MACTHRTARKSTGSLPVGQLAPQNVDIQFQLLNRDYADFQHMVDKAIVIENKIKEMEKGGKRKVSFSRQSSGSNVRPRFSQPN
jgi:hypothetical protein